MPVAYARFDGVAAQPARAQFVEREHGPLMGGDPSHPHIRSIVTFVGLRSTKVTLGGHGADRGVDRVTEPDAFASGSCRGSQLDRAGHIPPAVDPPALQPFSVHAPYPSLHR